MRPFPMPRRRGYQFHSAAGDLDDVERVAGADEVAADLGKHDRRDRFLDPRRPASTMAAANARLSVPEAASTAAVELASAALPAAWTSIRRTTASEKPPPLSRFSVRVQGQCIR